MRTSSLHRRASAAAVLAAAAALTLVPFSRLAAAQDEPKKGADAAEAPARSDFALTVYSTADPASFDPKQAAQARQANPAESLPGYGVVRETRRVTLEKGINTVRFTDVAAGIDPTTVSFASLTDPRGTAVVEQDYEFDLVGADKLLQKYLGRPVTVQPKGQAPFDATLLAAEPGTLVLRHQGQVRLIPRQPDPAEITLPALPSGLITKPTLVWKVAAEKPGAHDVRVSYQTDGLTWRADYNLVVSRDDKTADLNTWVSLLNESGASYPDATLKLVAGDVQRVEPQRVYPGAMMGMAAPAPAAPGFQEKTFYEYHLYTLGRPTSLADRSTKQIELFPARTRVPVTRTYVYDGAPRFRLFVSPAPNQDRNFGTQGNTKVDIDLAVKNTEENGMGLPLPAGRVRVYKKDEADAALEFVGEDTIGHTPKGETVRVKLGSAFDVVGERKQTDFRINAPAHVIDESFAITVRNHKPEPVRVTVREHLYRWVTWQITQASDRYEKQDARTVYFPIDVPADGEKTVRYTVRYTW
jgi:hypothetical protein